ncbi:MULTISPECIES: hypothetical protein [Rhodomicrobium]|uniref:hypothetical protein n=1 Tax=Rhodomicrobium TaxID=1068 RepID=UPI000B4B4532|nr:MULTISPECIES: hypothetical protein [Rhodomicrobium]
MNWDTVQQLLRIILYSVGAFVLGDAVASAELYQGLIAGTVNVAAFAWWWFWERNRATPPA